MLQMGKICYHGEWDEVINQETLAVQNFLILENYLFSCAPAWRQQRDLSYNLSLFSVGFFIPLSIIICTSTAVILILKKVLNNINEVVSLY